MGDNDTIYVIFPKGEPPRSVGRCLGDIALGGDPGVALVEDPQKYNTTLMFYSRTRYGCS